MICKFWSQLYREGKIVEASDMTAYEFFKCTKCNEILSDSVWFECNTRRSFVCSVDILVFSDIIAL